MSAQEEERRREAAEAAGERAYRAASARLYPTDGEPLLTWQELGSTVRADWVKAAAHLGGQP